MKWKYIDVGYSAKALKKDMQAEIMLHVGHGIPGNWDNTQGFAGITLRPKKPGVPVITERVLFLLKGAVVGEFYTDDGATADVGESWDIGTVSFISPEMGEDGDERNDDIMKEFVEKYIKTLVYTDELSTAQDEGFFRS